MAEADLHCNTSPLYNPGAHYYIKGDELCDKPVGQEDSLPLGDDEGFDTAKEEELKSQVEDIRDKFQELRKRLDKKEQSIIDGLDTDISDNEKENLKKQLETLYKAKANLEENMKDPKLAHNLGLAYHNILQQIHRIEKMLKSNKFVRWNINECEKSIDNVCVICDGRDALNRYKSKRGLLWESVEPGKERTQVNGPVGMTIEPITDRIVIADAGNRRIQVFTNEGNHLMEIPLVLDKVIFFTFLGESLFIIAMKDEQFLITKMESLGGVINCRTLVTLNKSYNDFFTIPDMSSLFLVDMKRNSDLTLTVCIYKNNHKIFTRRISAGSLEEIQPDGDMHVALRSPHIKDHTVAKCVRIVGLTHKLTQFYVLFHKSPYAIQVFNWDGELVKSVIGRITLSSARCTFLVNQEEHIIICTVKRTIDEKQNKDKQTTDCVVQYLYSNYVYTDDGNRQHKWTHKSTNRESVFRALRRPFQRRASAGGLGPRVPDTPVVGTAPYFGACLNSNQELVVLHVPEHSFLLRAF